MKEANFGECGRIFLQRKPDDKEAHPAKELRVGMSENMGRPNRSGIGASSCDPKERDGAESATSGEDCYDAGQKKGTINLNSGSPRDRAIRQDT